jgi:hypothetical protein
MTSSLTSFAETLWQLQPVPSNTIDLWWYQILTAVNTLCKRVEGTDVSEEYAAAMFRDKVSQGNKHQAECLLNSSTLNFEVAYSSETSVIFYQTIRRYTPDDSTLHYIYYHVFSDCRRGIGLTTGFIGSTLTTRGYTLQFPVTHTH